VEVAGLVAERIDADRQDMQYRARRLGAGGFDLNIKSRLRNFVDTDRPRLHF
jgi:hypothetical protein